MDMYLKRFAVGLILGIQLHDFSECRSLDGCIHKFDILNYNPKPGHIQHTNNIRNPSYVQHLYLQAFGRVIELKLKKDRSVFTSDHKSELGNRSLIDHDLSFLYSCDVKRMQDIYCHGSLIEGIFQGVIYLPNDTYYVEKSTRFFDGDPAFHSVIYRESDIGCKDFPKTSSTKYMKDALGVLDNNTRQGKGDKNKRPKRMNLNLGLNNTCALYLLSDPFMWDRYLQKSGGDREMAHHEILAMFASHVKTLNNILAKTTFRTFSDDIGFRGLQLAISRTRIMTDDECRDPSPSPYCSRTPDALDFLNLVSAENHDMFCLAYAFTRRDFFGGSLGLSWIASKDGSGGICEKYNPYMKNGKRFFASLNTGIITTVNYGKEVLPKVSHLNFAHEIGHSLGAQHDIGSHCAPFGTSMPDSQDGNYIMFDGALAGDRFNNERFSVCSKDSIAHVLYWLLNRPYNNCLIQNGPFCGNNIVEDGEECDCGFTDDCGESCCIPRDPGSGISSDMCKLKAGSVCSPSQGTCCAETCQYVTEGDNKVCSIDRNCKMASYCSGSSAICPTVTNKPDGTFCGHFASVCQNGECKASLCERIGWNQCFVTHSGGSTDAMCLLACMQNASSSQSEQHCIVSSDVLIDSFPEYDQLVSDLRRELQAAGLSVPTKGVYLPIGSPCNNYIGYCDTFHKCRSLSGEMFPLYRNTTGKSSTQSSEGTTGHTTESGQNELTTVSTTSKAEIRVVKIMFLYMILQAI